MALWLAVVPTAIAYLLFARGLRHLPAGEVATLTLGEPVTAAVLGAVVLSERPGPVAVIGIVLILAGLAVLAVPRRDGTRLTPAGAEISA
jgi:DME family drug/metabolite transporter